VLMFVVEERQLVGMVMLGPRRMRAIGVGVERWS
jgi:hypothetical protein